MSFFGMNAYTEMFVLLFHCIINDTFSQAMPDLRRSLLQFIDVMNLMSVANVSMHVYTYMPKEENGHTIKLIR